MSNFISSATSKW